MNSIIFDLEWNQPYYSDIHFLRRANMPLAGEIIQIGAVKVNDAMEVIDTFNIIVKPQILKIMHKHVSSLTGITTEDIALGVPFSKALHLFAKWCGEEPVLFSWGTDDILVLIDNMRLHGLQKEWTFSWYDAQRIYSHEKHQSSKQISLAKALQEGNISMELEAHNALHDARYTVRILREVDLKKGMAYYDDGPRQQSHTLIFPESLRFYVYDGYEEKKQVLRQKEVTQAFCPHCAKPLTLAPIEKTTGSKFLTTGSCTQHGEFAVLWKIQKYTGSKNKTLFYCTKNITAMNEAIRAYYLEKARINAEKAEKYAAFLRAKEHSGSKDRQG